MMAPTRKKIRIAGHLAPVVDLRNVILKKPRFAPTCHRNCHYGHHRHRHPIPVSLVQQQHRGHRASARALSVSGLNGTRHVYPRVYRANVYDPCIGWYKKKKRKRRKRKRRMNRPTFEAYRGHGTRRHCLGNGKQRHRHRRRRPMER